MPENIKLNPLGLPVREIPLTVPRKTYLINLKVDFHKETGTTTPNYEDRIDQLELTQTYKDQCGMEAAKAMLKTGMAMPGDFADDGNHSGEVTEDLEDIQKVSNAAINAAKGTASLADQLDLPDGAEKMTEEQLTALISKAIQEKYPNIIKQEEKPNAE